MNKIIALTILSLVIFTSCKKVNTSNTSGTSSIDNTIYKATTYFAYGFSFSKAGKVATTATPGPDIVLYVNNDTGTPRLTLQASNLNNSFSKVGDYVDAASAETAFKNLLTVGSVLWTGQADPVRANQVWLYRTNDEQYVKIRIVSVINETRSSVAFGQITFEWVFQPDGTSTFPAK